MSTITDVYGRTITVTPDQSGHDVYSLAGVTVSFPTGTPQAQAVATIEGMAPAGYTPPKANWTFLEFMALFTPTEQTAIVNTTDPQIRLFCLMAASAGQLQLTNPEVVQGVEYLAMSGVIVSGRVAVILAGQAPA